MSKNNFQVQIDRMELLLRDLEVKKEHLETQIQETQKALTVLLEEARKHLPLNSAMKQLILALKNGWRLYMSTLHCPYSYVVIETTSPSFTIKKVRKSVAEGLLDRKIVEIEKYDRWRLRYKCSLTEWGKSIEV